MELSGRSQMRFKRFCEFACIVSFQPAESFCGSRVRQDFSDAWTRFVNLSIYHPGTSAALAKVQLADCRSRGPGMAQVRHHCGNHGILPRYGSYLELRMSPGQRRRAAEQTANRDLAGCKNFASHCEQLQCFPAMPGQFLPHEHAGRPLEMPPCCAARERRPRFGVIWLIDRDKSLWRAYGTMMDSGAGLKERNRRGDWERLTGTASRAGRRLPGC